MARFCQIKIWDKLTLIKRMHLQHCLPTAKKQLAASLSPYCLHPSLSSPPDSAGQTPPWGAVQSANLDEPCGGGRVGLLLSILRTCVWETKRNLILETYFYFLEEKSPVNIFKGCQLWSGLFCAFQSKTVFSGSVSFLLPLSYWLPQVITGSHSAKSEEGSHVLPQNGFFFFPTEDILSKN